MLLRGPKGVQAERHKILIWALPVEAFRFSTVNLYSDICENTKIRSTLAKANRMPLFSEWKLCKDLKNSTQMQRQMVAKGLKEAHRKRSNLAKRNTNWYH